MIREERLQAYKMAMDPNFALSQTLAKVLASIPHLKGDDGYTPVKGKDYFTDEELSQIIAYIRSQLKDGESGEKGDKGDKGNTGLTGKTGEKGIDGETPICGVDYYTSTDEDKLLKKILAKIPKPKDGVSVKPEEVTKIVMGNLEKIRKDDHKAIVNEILNNPVLRMLLHGGGSSSGGTTSPLTTKGDIYAFSTVNDRLPIGVNGQVLSSDSTQPTGLKWITNAGGSGITRSINVVAGNTTAASAVSIDYVYFCSTVMTLTLPTAIGNTNRYTVIHKDTSTLTIATIGGQTIAFYPPAPATTATVTVQGTVIEIYSDGTNWWTI